MSENPPGVNRRANHHVFILILPKFKRALPFIDDNDQGCAALVASGPSKPNSLNSPVRILTRSRRIMASSPRGRGYPFEGRLDLPCASKRKALLIQCLSNRINLN
jgi:hypothetical protein